MARIKMVFILTTKELKTCFQVVMQLKQNKKIIFNRFALNVKSYRQFQ